MISSDEEPIPTCMQALVALDRGDIADARKLVIQAGTEMRDLREDHARLSRRAALKLVRLKEFEALSRKPLDS